MLRAASGSRGESVCSRCPPEAGGEPLSQKPSCAVKARLHAFTAEAQAIRGFQDVQLVDHAQYEDLPVPFRERRHGRSDGLAQLAIEGLFLGIANSGDEGGAAVVDWNGDGVQQWKPPAATQVAERLVDGDTGQPRIEARTAGKLVEASHRPQVSVLEDVLHFIVAPENVAHQRAEGPLVAAHQNLVERGVSGSHTLQQSLFGEDSPGIGGSAVGHGFRGSRSNCGAIGLELRFPDFCVSGPFVVATPWLFPQHQPAGPIWKCLAATPAAGRDSFAAGAAAAAPRTEAAKSGL